LHLCLGLPNGLFPSGFPTTILYAILISAMRVTCSAHLIILNLFYGNPIWSSELKYTFSCCFKQTKSCTVSSVHMVCFCVFFQ
jgi:hypothetical protein